MLLLTLCALAIADAAAAPIDDTVPFVVAVDDGTVATTPFDAANAGVVINALLDDYIATGAELPEILSVWTAFPFNSNVFETRFIPVGNDITGIGLENAFGEGEELFDQVPPMRAMLIHNDVTALAERAELMRLPTGGFGEYLFLLELAHVWGPEIRVPSVDGPEPDDVMIGFGFHWSFFADHGGSPAGGNLWSDNGDGSFTAPVLDVPNIAFGPLDLYLMGLAPADEVPPFGVLEDVVVPEDAIDPFTGRTVNAASFPWQGPEPLTVTATRRAFTIDDVIATNGPRSPAFGDSPTSFTLGVMLVVPEGIADDERDAIAREFAPLAAALTPSFARATGNRGSLALITSSPAPPPVQPLPDEPPPDGEGEGEDEPPPGCAGAPAPLAFALLALALRRRARR